MKPSVYLAGAFTSSTPEGVAFNKCRARMWANAANRTGLIRIVLPHNASEGIDASLSETDWIELTEWLRSKCDGTIMMPGWQSSPGSCKEYDAALAQGQAVVIADTLDTVNDTVVALLNEIEYRAATERHMQVLLGDVK